MKAQDYIEQALDTFLEQKLCGIELPNDYFSTDRLYKVAYDVVNRRNDCKELQVTTVGGKVRIYRRSNMSLEFVPYVPDDTRTDIARRTLDNFLESGQEIVLLKDKSDYYYPFYRAVGTPKYRGVRVRRAGKDLVLINGR